MSEPHKRKCHDCGNVAVHMDNIVPEVLCKKCGSQDTRLIKGDKPKAGIKVTSVLGDSRIEITDGMHSIGVGLTKMGVAKLIDELRIALNWQTGR